MEITHGLIDIMPHFSVNLKGVGATPVLLTGTIASEAFPETLISHLCEDTIRDSFSYTFDSDGHVTLSFELEDVTLNLALPKHNATFEDGFNYYLDVVLNNIENIKMALVTQGK